MNKVTCLTCGEVIESLHRHDFRSCSCPEETQVSVDGGKDYERRLYGPKAKWHEWVDAELIGANIHSANGATNREPHQEAFSFGPQPLLFDDEGDNQ